MRLGVITRKTVGDLSNGKVLAGFLVLYGGVQAFFALGLATDLGEDAATLAAEEAALAAAFLPMTYLWGTGIAVMLLGAAFGALALAKEAEQGSLRILLSKPVRRWEVFVGTYVATATYLSLAAVATTLTGATSLFLFGDLSAAALEGGLFELLPGLVAYALFLSAFTAAVVLALSVFTADRLRTALGTLSLPAVFFVCWVVKLVDSEFYADNHLYVVDVGYHLGNAFVVIQEAVSGPMSTEAKAVIGLFAGTHEQPPEDAPMPDTLELTGYVDPEVSVAALAALAVVALVAAAVRFQRIDL